MGTQSKGTALITGASTGIGAVYADRLARRGYDLILVARSVSKLGALAKRITDETGRSVEIVPSDLYDKKDLLRVEQILKSDASITLLLNNAGIGSHKPLLDSSVDAMDDLISLNITALTRLTYAAVPGFVARGHGAIINISSIAGIAPELLNGVYGASKAYVLAFSHSLQHELSEKGIRTQAVLPGATDTPFWDVAGLPSSNLPPEIVMTTEDLVDAALAGFDQGELVTIPPLPEKTEWDRWEAARREMTPRLSLKEAAPRYGISRH